MRLHHFLHERKQWGGLEAPSETAVAAGRPVMAPLSEDRGNSEDDSMMLQSQHPVTSLGRLDHRNPHYPHILFVMFQPVLCRGKRLFKLGTCATQSPDAQSRSSGITPQYSTLKVGVANLTLFSPAEPNRLVMELEEGWRAAGRAAGAGRRLTTGRGAGRRGAEMAPWTAELIWGVMEERIWEMRASWESPELWLVVLVTVGRGARTAGTGARMAGRGTVGRDTVRPEAPMAPWTAEVILGWMEARI